MAKTYIDTVKYLVYANVEIGGLVEKPDVVGAIFGQTEGLLGDELDLRDLQKNGRIGRIEVDLNGRDGKAIGMIKVPSSLDMVETCIIAAALETVDRVGPCEANIKVQKVEDTRNAKRKILIDRAKGLLKNLINVELPESKEISDMVRDEVKIAEIGEYGPDRLPAGPGIDRSNEVVFVEGRADVINLLKNDITNVVAIQGAKVTPTIIELSKGKEVTVFLDGDRGGDIILNELVQGGAEIDFVARAPTGKEVEELTRKELIKCLRGKVPFEQSSSQGGDDAAKRRSMDQRPRRMERVERRQYDEPRDELVQKPAQRLPVFHQFERKTEQTERRFEQPVERPYQKTATVEQKPERIERAEKTERNEVAPIQPVVPPVVITSKEELWKELEELGNTLKARFYNSGMERVKEMQVRDVIKALEEVTDVHAIVFDGIVTQRLVDLAHNKGVKTIIGVKIGNVNKKPEGLEIMTKSK